ncbi:hypothetical protein AcetOrient_orf01671 [Acetobacter orientalis]|uniref:Uncharacterized protein n=1 Tax=Acetobacter orientalis TaxID=146474 RepID=A0A2Z5ZGG6_9PROT|nr:hypothetical protein AcetOrient_orf01671 [Acetobacter orientalis]
MPCISSYRLARGVPLLSAKITSGLPHSVQPFMLSRVKAPP